MQPSASPTSGSLGVQVGLCFPRMPMSTRVLDSCTRSPGRLKLAMHGRRHPASFPCGGPTSTWAARCFAIGRHCSTAAGAANAKRRTLGLGVCQQQHSSRGWSYCMTRTGGRCASGSRSRHTAQLGPSGCPIEPVAPALDSEARESEESRKPRFNLNFCCSFGWHPGAQGSVFTAEQLQ